jgi:RHS repeat-associated protein
MAMAAFKPATGGTGSTTMYIIHADHLTGTNVVTDANGDVVEVADYYPYGNERISSGSFEEQRKFAGTEYDSGTGLNYMGARYYAGGKGRFLSEDPVFLSVGSPELKQKTGLELAQYLSNPQQINSYSYANNNPLKYVDQQGEFAQIVSALFGLFTPTTAYAPRNESDLNASMSGAQMSFVAAEIIATQGKTAGVKAAGSLRSIENAGSVGKSSLSDSALVCRGGSCTAEAFLKGSNEYKAGLNPSLDTPVTGISVNVGKSLEPLPSVPI